ncbi:hypothetical protein Nepgr_012652 [Nepenthes gracilis]|uniref:Uncharacterized protein n=1 Tax=Nepenthes gracilis TaxID=150966 RepID=A0AAD3SHX4_NEPGR|nr:hypothetical protein Nepgr_012652 [Nepenthes gracilis]
MKRFLSFLLHPEDNLPRPWFILACLGVGIIVCLITLCGHMVANCINKAVLCIYIVSICSLVLLQGAVIIAIFFKMDLASQLDKYIDEVNKSFKSFAMFHLYMCRAISIMALVLQINIVMLAITIFFVGSEPLSHSNILDVPDFKHSFLISPYSTVNDDDEFSRTGTKFEFILGVTPIESYF